MSKTVHVNVDKGDTVVVHTNDKPDIKNDPLYPVVDAIDTVGNKVFGAIIDVFNGKPKDE